LRSNVGGSQRAAATADQRQRGNPGKGTKKKKKKLQRSARWGKAPIRPSAGTPTKNIIGKKRNEDKQDCNGSFPQDQ